MISKLLIIEAELIHKVSCHLLDLVVRKGLKKKKNIIMNRISTQQLIRGAPNILNVCLCAIPAVLSVLWGRDSPYHPLRKDEGFQYQP